MTIYDFNVKDTKGNDVSLGKYKGQVVLITNVASKCGLTPQYKGLQKIYDAYKNQGFSILGFPCNQFMGQEPGTNEEILSFCSLTYDVSFDIFGKIEVNGENTDPLYVYLKNELPTKEVVKSEKQTALYEHLEKYDNNLLKNENISWNFSKFLVNKEGKVVKRYEPYIEPEEIAKDIEVLL